MDEQRFWDLVEAAWAPLGTGAARTALATRDSGTDGYEMPEFTAVAEALDGFIDNLRSLARDLGPAELTGLDRVVERLLHDIDRYDVHEVTEGSDDGFLYARGFIVALGREFYTAVAADPRLAIEDAWCERMCYLFAGVHKERFGDYPDTGSGISRESCTNAAGWPD